MKRRTFLGLLCGLPFVGVLFRGKAKPPLTMTEAMWPLSRDWHATARAREREIANCAWDDGTCWIDEEPGEVMYRESFADILRAQEHDNEALRSNPPSLAELDERERRQSEQHLLREYAKWLKDRV